MVSHSLPREVYVLQAGLVVNAFGNGAANPFLVVYLHDVRGMPLGIAGLVSATSATCALVATLVAGGVADRRGARGTMIWGLVASAIGFALYPLVREPWQALTVAVIAGAGIGTWLTMQSALLAAIVPPDVRHLAFAQQRVAANVGLGLGAFAGGLIVTTGDAVSFTRLFLLNVATFVVYAGVLVALRTANPELRRAPNAAGYRAVLRDRLFLRFLALNFVFVAGTISLVNALFPVFAIGEGGIEEYAVGALFLLNAVLIITAQIPVARSLEGHRRMAGFALMGVLFAACWVLVLAGGAAPSPALALALFTTAIVCLSLGECIYDSVQGPLTAALAPEQFVGRYMAANGFSWQLGFIVGPGVGGLLLSLEPYALWPAAAVLALAGAAYSLHIDRLVPAAHRRTPSRRPGTLRADDLPHDRRPRIGAPRR